MPTYRVTLNPCTVRLALPETFDATVEGAESWGDTLDDDGLHLRPVDPGYSIYWVPAYMIASVVAL